MAEASPSRDGIDPYGDDDTFDEVDVDCEPVKTIGDVDEMMIHDAMSIYKVKNSKLGIHDEFKGTEEDLETEINNQFKRKQKDELICKFHTFEINKCKQYYVCLFTYQSKASNRVAPDLALQRRAEQTAFKAGRRTGNIIVFYRIDGDKKPEIFFLCSGYSHATILKFVDVDVRTEMIKSYLKDSNIKKIKYLSLSGPEIETTFVYRTNTEQDFFRHFDIFGKIITYVSGEIEPESDLAKCINLLEEKDRAKTIRIDFGTYNVKFARRLTTQKWTEVIALISECMAHKDKKYSQTQRSIIDAFESIQKVEDTTQLKNLYDKLNSRLVDVISTDTATTDLYFGNKRPNDFTLASSFILKLKEGRKYNVIQSWGSSPTVNQVITALKNDDHEDLETSRAVQRALEDKRIGIAFKSETVSSRLEPIQSLIHGTEVMDDVMYFKLCTSWYSISPSYLDRINRDFERLAENAVFKDEKESIVVALKYTWSYKSQYFTIHGIQNEFDITKDDAECLVNILSEWISPCKGGKFLLTQNKNMYLLPSSNRAMIPLVDRISKALQDNKEQREETLKYIWDLSQKKEKIRDETKLIMGLEFEVVIAEFQTQGNGETTYKVKNPILSAETERKLNDKLPAVDITNLLSYLRSLLPLSEGEYNELYLHPQHKNVIIPGDRVRVNNVELFDLLIHSESEKVTYLVHNKKSFDVCIRDVCSQIRVSATLLWKDYMGGTQTHAELFWKTRTSKAVNTVYRLQLREKLEAIGEERFISYFDRDIKIVFVLGFRHKIPDYLKRPSQVQSTIAKIELLTLCADFAKFQIGSWRKFELKLLQLKSDGGSDNKKRMS